MLNLSNIRVYSKDEEIDTLSPWTPSGYMAFRLLLAARMCAALWSNISDCDETYNYWEPVSEDIVSYYVE